MVYYVISCTCRQLAPLSISLSLSLSLPRLPLQVEVGEHKCQGVGPNKKLAKRSAAELMLQQLGYSKASPQPAKPSLRSSDATSGGGGEKKVTFIDQDAGAACECM